jgi:hypothetical protein
VKRYVWRVSRRATSCLWGMIISAMWWRHGSTECRLGMCVVLGIGRVPLRALILTLFGTGMNFDWVDV